MPRSMTRVRRSRKSRLSSVYVNANDGPMYVCIQCGRSIHATADDPVFMSKKGAEHPGCALKRYYRRQREDAKREVEVREKRSANMTLAAWIRRDGFITWRVRL